MADITEIFFATRSTDGIKISEQKFQKEDLRNVNIFPKIIIHTKVKAATFQWRNDLNQKINVKTLQIIRQINITNLII